MQRDSSKPNLDAIVIGGGVAGLLAALRLKQSNHSVAIFEATSQVGGRICTHHSRDGIVELGGQWVGEFHSAYRSLCNELAIPVTQAPRLSLKQQIPDSVWLNGSFLSTAKVQGLRTELFALCNQMAELSAKVDPVRPWKSSVFELNRCTVWEWMTDHGYSRELCELFSDLPPRGQSMLALLALVAGGGGFPFFTDTETRLIEGGASRVPITLGKLLKSNVHLEHAVHSLSNAGGEVMATVCSSSGTEVVRARTAILATPAPIATFLFDNGVALPKMCSNCNVCVFAKHTHTARHMHPHILSNTPLRIVDAEVDAESQSDTIRFDIFVASHLLESTPLAQLVMHYLQAWYSVSTLHEPQLITKSWASSKWAQGAYAMFGPNALSKHYERIISGTPPIFFAGDYVIPGYCGFMEGAVRSAELAANQVINWLHSA